MLKKLYTFTLSSFTNPQPHTNVLRAFYALNMLGFLLQKNEILSKQFLPMSNILHWPLWWARGMELGPYAPGFLLSGLLTCMITFIFPHVFLFRLLVLINWLLTTSLMYAFGDTAHTFFPWIFVTMLCVFESNKHPYRVLDWARPYCLTIYVNAALWKTRALFDVPFSELPHEVSKVFVYILARGYSEGTQHNPNILFFLNDHPVISSFVWFTVIFTQMSGAIMLFFPRFDWFWGILLISFHCGAFFTLGVDFEGHLSLLAYVFILYPMLKKLKPD